MKKLLSIVLCAVMLATATLLPVNAVYDKDVVNTATATLRDMTHNGADYAVLNDLYELYANAEEGKYEAVDADWCTAYIVPADDFEAEYNKRIVVTDQRLRTTRDLFAYDADAQTYTVCHPGGVGGGNRYEYVGYVDNEDGTYDFYYGIMEREYLSKVIAEEDIPEGMDKWDYIETLYDSKTFAYYYKGNEYHTSADEDSPFRYNGVSDHGIKFTIEINDGIVRVLSEGDYSASDLPEQFETKPAVIRGDANADGVVDPFDYLLVKKIYFNTESYTPDQLALADVNGDGEVDAFDYLEVKTIYFKSN